MSRIGWQYVLKRSATTYSVWPTVCLAHRVTWHYRQSVRAQAQHGDEAPLLAGQVKCARGSSLFQYFLSWYAVAVSTQPKIGCELKLVASQRHSLPLRKATFMTDELIFKPYLFGEQEK